MEKPLPEYFNRVGDLTDRLWTDKGRMTRAFPHVAAQALKEFPPCEHIAAHDVVQWVLGARELPRQHIEHRFGEPGIQVFARPDFFIEVLFWLEGSPDIHQHGFSGAFYVLAGSSVHTEWTFKLNTQFDDNLRAGILRVLRTEYLGQGSCRSIESGRDFIHSLSHLERPSVTIVVRTTGEPDATPQWSYQKPGLAWNPFHRDECLSRQIDLLDMLFKVDRSQYVDAAICAIARPEMSPYGVFKILNGCFDKNDEDAFSRLLEATQQRERALAEIFQDVFSNQARDRHLQFQRNVLREPGHRLALAILVDAPGRQAALELVHSKFPDAEPASVLGRLIGEMATVKSRGFPTLLSSFSDVDLLMIPEILASYRPDVIADELGKKGIEASTERVRDCYDRVRCCSILRHLLDDSDAELRLPHSSKASTLSHRKITIENRT